MVTNKITVLGTMFQSLTQFVILKGFHMLDLGGLILIVYLIWFRIMRTNLREGPWGIFCRVHVSVHWEGVIYLECGRYHIMGQGPSPENAKEKFGWAPACTPLCSLTTLAMWPAASSSCHCPLLMMDQTVSKKNPSPFFVFCHTFCHIARKTNAHLKIAKKKIHKNMKKNLKE